MIGLAVFAPQIALGMGFTQGTIAFGFVQAGIMLAGGLLINAVLSPSTPSLSTNDNLSTSTTYSWTKVL